MATRITNLRSAGGAWRPRSIPAGAFALAAALALGVAIIALAVGTPSRDGAPSAAPAVPAADAAPAVAPFAVYLAASPEEAMEFRRSLTTLTPGGLTGDADVLTAGMPEEEARAWVAVRTLERERGAGGVRVLDLRRPGAVPAATSAPPCDATPTDRAAPSAC